MIERIEIAAPAVSLLLLVIVLVLIRQRKLIEEYSILWILSSIALLILSLRRQALHDAALTVPVVVLIAVVCAASLSFSVIASRQRRQIERLVEETAILSAELRELRDHPPSPNRPPA